MSRKHDNPFPFAMRPDTPSKSIMRVQVAHCGACDREQTFNRPHGAPLPVEVIAGKLRDAGWTVKRDGRFVRCATCSGRKDVVNEQGETMINALACCVDGCEADLVLPRSSRATPGSKIPISIVAQAVQREGWYEDDRGHPYCPVHAMGGAAMRLLFAHREGGGAAIMKLMKDRGLSKLFPSDFQFDEAASEKACETARERAVLFLGEPTVTRLQADHEAILRKATAKRPNPTAVRIAPPPPPATEEADMTKTPALSAAPRTPTREEKRAIMDKLNEVYDDGYSGSWSDRKVAEGLNVPTAWVVEIRSEFFGDAVESEADRAARKERERAINELKSDLKAVKADQRKALDALADADNKIPGIEARLARLEQGK